MNIEGGAGIKVKSNKNLFIILGIAGGLLFCCVIVFALVFSGLLSKLFTSNTPSPANRNVTPPHYGVFVKQNGELLELQEQEIFEIPIEREMANAQAISDTQPTLVVWRSNTNLDYLEMYKLNQYLGEPKNNIRYNAMPKNDGVIEITPVSSLNNGIYCLIQGDPMAATLPGWCFRIGSISQNQLPVTAIATETQTSVAIKATETFSPDLVAAWQKCESYEDAKEQDKTIECYKNLTEAYPNFFYAWDNLERVYGNNNEFQKALDAAYHSLDTADTPENETEAYLSIGVDYYNLGDYKSAVENLQKGYKIEQPSLANHINILVWLSRSYEANGQREDACKSWKETLELAESDNYSWAIDWANSGLAKCS